MMDIYKYMSDNELKKAIGTTIYFVCEELQIETNITDYEVW